MALRDRRPMPHQPPALRRPPTPHRPPRPRPGGTLTPLGVNRADVAHRRRTLGRGGFLGRSGAVAGDVNAVVLGRGVCAPEGVLGHGVASVPATAFLTAFFATFWRRLLRRHRHIGGRRGRLDRRLLLDHRRLLDDGRLGFLCHRRLAVRLRLSPTGVAFTSATFATGPAAARSSRSCRSSASTRA